MNIQTFRDLKICLSADLKNNHEIFKKNIFIEYLKGNLKVYYKFKFIIYLRFMEYCVNNKQGIFGKIRYLLFKRRFQRLQMKTQLYINPNTCAEGLNIEHLGYIWVDKSSKLGKNNVILPRVLFGKKSPGIQPRKDSDSIITTGDNVYIGTGSTILGPVKIGNNVIIAAGSIVTSDIPDNSICVGAPAKVIRTLEQNQMTIFFPYLNR